MSGHKLKAGGSGQNTGRDRGVSPRTREKTAQEDPRRGGTPKAQGSPGQVQASFGEASPPSNVVPVFLGPSPDDSPTLDSIPTFIQDAPVLELSPQVAGPSRNQLQACRSPSLKNVGRDAKGQVIPHFRSEEVAKVVAQYSLTGHDLNFIAAMLNIRPGLLKKHYYNELAHSAAAATANVVSTAYAMAVSGESEAMTKFWLERRAREKFGAHPGDGDSPVLNIHIHAGDESPGRV